MDRATTQRKSSGRWGKETQFAPLTKYFHLIFNGLLLEKGVKNILRLQNDSGEQRKVEGHDHWELVGGQRVMDQFWEQWSKYART